VPIQGSEDTSVEYKAKNIDWNESDGRQLAALARALPSQPRLDITVFGSAPLQLMIERAFLWKDSGRYSPAQHWDFVTKLVGEIDWVKDKWDFYIQVWDPRDFHSTFDWRDRAVKVERHGHLFRFVHPLDALVNKLQRLNEKDLEDFKVVIARTGHPTEAEFVKHLQNAVDLYRPKFDEETARGDMLLNTRELWKILWNKEIDVRAAIIRPALEHSLHDPIPADPALKTRLANLKLPPE
jgi:hypothetical protein